MSEFEKWLKELSKTHEVPNAPFVVEAMRASFEAGRDSMREELMAKWPSEAQLGKMLIRFREPPSYYTLVCVLRHEIFGGTNEPSQHRKHAQSARENRAAGSGE